LPERCFVSRQNREAGSRKFASDGKQIIRDHQKTIVAAILPRNIPIDASLPEP